ncbi:MAG TPA: FlgD immunoglobulin-like domain containing protein, partial [Candidatus Eisenbacteria bacterium]|nr:FlgD immunoglobulin-like domain containing protein [Candidatus Eisenbacteria bacterium]
SSTYFPSVAVNGAGDVQFGFSASGATFHAGAYMTGRHATDPAGTVRETKVVRLGMDYYVRMFGGDTRNRWGDYSGISNDPFDDRIFWVYNQYAWTRGTSGVGTGDGRWKTAWRAAARSCVSVGCPPAASLHGGDPFSLSFCITNCGALRETMTYTVSNDAGWCAPVASSVSVNEGTTVCINVNCTVPVSACAPDSNVFHFQAVSGTGETASCATTIHVLHCAIGPQLEVAPASVLFPSVALLDTACSEVRIRNTGDQNLAVFSVTGCNAGEFFLNLAGLASTVPPGDSTSFAICFAPENGGADSCEVTVATNDGSAVVPVHVGTVTAVPEGDLALGLGLRVIPNPFSGSARIHFYLREAVPVRVDVLDLSGRRVRRVVDATMPKGDHEARWSGEDDQGRPSARGLYFVRIHAGHAQSVARTVKLE